MERRLYSERPPREDYMLTARGRDFRPILWAILAWGNRHFAPEGASVVAVNLQTGALAEPIVVDRITGLPMTQEDFRSARRGLRPMISRRRRHTRPESAQSGARQP